MTGLTRMPVGSGPSLPIQRLPASASARAAALAPAAAARSGGGRRRLPKQRSGHEFLHGLHLCVEGEVANSCMSLHRRFGRRPRRGAKGGGRLAAGVRLGKNKTEARISFLTTRRSLGERGAAGKTATVEIGAGGQNSRLVAAGSIGRKGTSEGGWGARCE
jgi:hypothetical protein